MLTRSSLIALCASAIATSALAQSEDANLDPGAAPQPAAVSILDAAAALAEFGRAEGSPTILLGAAAAIRAVGESVGDDPIEEEGAADDAKSVGSEISEKSEEGAAEDRDLAAELIDEARFLSRGDATILAQADALEASASKGSTAGPHSHRFRLNPRKYLRQVEKFRGGQTAEVLIIGDGDTNVDLAVYDENGREICTSQSGGDREFCSWTPRWTGPFTIKISNYGRVYNDVALFVN